MLCDLPPELLTRGEIAVWKERFLPTPVLNLLEGLVRATDVECHVLSFSRKDSARGRLWGRVGVEVVKVPRGTGLSALYLPRALAVRRTVYALRPDVVHGQGVESGYAWLATLQPRPHAITLHGVLGVTAQRGAKGAWPLLGRIVQAATLARAQNIIAISDFVGEWASESSAARIYRVPNAVHRSFYELGSRRETDLDVLYVGRIAPEKGLLDAIVALRLLERRGIVLRMGVVGRATDTSYERVCRTHAASLLQSTVAFYGPIGSVSTVMGRARLLVLPSLGENFSMVAAEASAAGVPVVAYRVGGLPSIVKNGETGMLVEPGDTEALADAVAALATDERLRRRMAEAARERALVWHQDKVAVLTAAAYEDIVSGRTRRGEDEFRPAVG